MIKISKEVLHALHNQSACNTDNNQSEAGIDALSRFLPSLASMLLELTSFKNLSNSDELREVCVSCVLSDELQDRLMQNNIQDIFQLLSQDTTLH